MYVETAVLASMATQNKSVLKATRIHAARL